jgi:6-bladed beta-propeller
MRIQFPVLAVSLSLAVAACSGDSGGGWAGTVTDSAGIQIVNNPIGGMWTSETQPAITDELTIGATGGDPNYEFGQIVGIDVGSDGTIYVLDQQARQVRAFDAEGKYLRTIGKPGSGPGELSQMVFGVVVTPGDTLMVPDLGLQRVTRYGPDGQTIGSFPTPMNEGISVRWQARAGGQVVQQARIMNLPGQTTQVEPKDLLLLRNAQGELLDTLMQLPGGQTLKMTGNSMTIRLFEAEPVWGLGEDGSVYFAMNSDYNVEIHGAKGALERIVRRPFERRPVTDDDKQAFLKAIRQLFGQRGLPPQALDQILGNIQFAESYPAFANLMGGPGQSLWVQRVRTAADVKEGAEFDLQNTGSPEWDIFGPNGRYLGVIQLPDKFAPLRVSGDRIYGVWRDDLDVQHVKRLHIDMGARTFGETGG